MDLRLRDREVHVWLLPLHAYLEAQPTFAQCLARDERDRAAAYRQADARRQFVVTRGALRLLLGRYLNRDARDVGFEYSAYGKPGLAGEDAWLQFNVAHTTGWALIALSHRAAVGIDIEAIRLLPDLDHIAERYFAPGERLVLSSLPYEQRSPAFYTCWTRKEACLKGVGMGLHQPLDQFDVALDLGGPVVLQLTPTDPEAHPDWTLLSLPVPDGCAGALAINASDYILCMWKYGGIT